MSQLAENLARDLRYALRNLAQRPSLTATALLSLTLGIGANTAIFTLVNAFFLRPLPVEEPARLVAIFGTYASGARGGSTHFPLSYPDILDYREQNDVLSGLLVQAPLPLSLSSSGDAERLLSFAVSANYFDLLGVKPVLGRAFLPEEERPGSAAAVIVLSHGLWSRRFGADPDLVGGTITVNRRPFTVVGIGPPGFKGLGRAGEVDAWIPIGLYEAIAPPEFASMLATRDGRLVYAVGRLKPGVDLARAQAGMGTVARRLEQEYPTLNAGWGVKLIPLNDFYTRPEQSETQLRARTLLLLAMALVLLISCVNVANLLLVRAGERRREIAIRLSIGADRKRLIRQLLTESILLAVAGGALGLLVAAGGVRFLWGIRPPQFAENALDLSLDGTVLLFTLALSVATGILFGLIPAFRGSRTDLVGALKGQSAAAAGAHRRWSPRHLLVIAQVGLCLICLICAGLFLRSLRNAQNVDPGFDTEHLVLAAIDLRAEGYDEPSGRRFLERVLERLGSLPGVQSVSTARTRLLSGFEFMNQIVPEGHEMGEKGNNGVLIRSNNVGLGYFATLGIPIVRGRAFTAADQPDTPPVAVINETMAAQLWPGQDPVGKRFRFDLEEKPVEVVGVAKDAKYTALLAPTEPYVYLSSEQRYSSGVTLYVHAAGGPAPIAKAVQKEMRDIDPKMPLVGLQTMPELIASTLWAPRLGAGVLSFFGLLALLLSMVGVYGVMISSVNQRRTEIGMRMALGARRGDVVRLVLREAAIVVGSGVALGLACALFATRVLATLLFGVEATDPATLAGVSMLLLAVALIASLLPARRAATIDPLIAIRQA